LDDRRTAVVVHSDGSVEIEARQQVTVKGRGITLDAGAGELTLRGRSVSVDGGTQVDIQAPLVTLN
ncbi:hypothetical protein QLR68_30945, partial [Micromonospora sp. DH15]|nr:hypothetical protein [Micromonospora sp. DH15]